VQELFGAIGPLKRARLLKAGVAEVVFVDRQDAVTATQRYHLRELDGQSHQQSQVRLFICVFFGVLYVHPSQSPRSKCLLNF